MLERTVLHAVVLAGFTMLCGCEYIPLGKTTQTNLEEDEFGDLAESESSSDAPRSESQRESDSESGLALRLEVGQRFPLEKRVEQRLTQALPTGMSVGHSRLELQLSLVVEEVRSQRHRLGVRYHRVRFQQELSGQTTEYNSDRPPASIPAEALPYAGLKDNGFSFWLDSENQVRELVGFADFLKRCVQHVPPEQRVSVLQQLQSLRTEDGLANFVDDSIGLLPGAAVKSSGGLRVGSTWDLPVRTLSIGGSAALSSCTTRCLLKDLNDKTAEISLAGSIGPSSYTDELRHMRLTVRNGQCTGMCTVDRSTGIPTRSRVDRVIDMLAQLPDGTEIAQRKEVITTIVAYLEQRQTADTGMHRPEQGKPTSDDSRVRLADHRQPR